MVGNVRQLGNLEVRRRPVLWGGPIAFEAKRVVGGLAAFQAKRVVSGLSALERLGGVSGLSFRRSGSRATEPTEGEDRLVHFGAVIKRSLHSFINQTTVRLHQESALQHAAEVERL